MFDCGSGRFSVRAPQISRETGRPTPKVAMLITEVTMTTCEPVTCSWIFLRVEKKKKPSGGCRFCLNTPMIK